MARPPTGSSPTHKLTFWSRGTPKRQERSLRAVERIGSAASQRPTTAKIAVTAEAAEDRHSCARPNSKAPRSARHRGLSRARFTLRPFSAKFAAIVCAQAYAGKPNPCCAPRPPLWRAVHSARPIKRNPPPSSERKRTGRLPLALQLHILLGSESMGDHDSEPDDWWRID